MGTGGPCPDAGLRRQECGVAFLTLPLAFRAPEGAHRASKKESLMTMHRSFAGSGGLSKHRNVLTRKERLERLKAEGKWTEAKGVFNLPKVRNIKAT